MSILLKPIGYVRHPETDIPVDLPRHWSMSSVEGDLEIFPDYLRGLQNIEAGQQIVVLFHFHQSAPFAGRHLIQRPPRHGKPTGVFSTCSPIRPNPLGLSVLTVLNITGNVIHVKGMDMRDGTPILDIKPHIEFGNKGTS
jgi:tRNA-Thr(GGU) m(6)t(6)A37 methyltransferase TsaA